MGSRSTLPLAASRLLLRPLCGLVALAPCGASAAQQAPFEPEILVRNGSAEARGQIVRVTVPLPRGLACGVSQVLAGGRAVPAVPLVRWPDGSAAALQVHVPVAVLGAGEQLRLPIRLPAAGSAPPPEPAGAWPLEAGTPFSTEVEDPWGRVFRATWRPDPAPLSTSSSLVRVRRYRALHRRGDQVFLGLLAYLTTFRGEDRAELTVVLDNRASPHVPGPALGPVRLRRFSLLWRGDCRVRARLGRENGIGSVQELAGGGHRLDLLGPSDQLYLGDRTGKAFRLDLTAAGGPLAPRLSAWATLATVRRSGAFGTHGGPAPRRLDRSREVWRSWRRNARFGPFGGFGDPRDAAAQGTPRNGPSALYDAVCWQSDLLVERAEAMVLQQTLRPTPATEPRRPAAMEAFRQGLSPRVIARPHGFTALDYEHFSVDLCYDFYWLTGDPLARDELARAGSALPRLLDGLPFSTCRGEGWCLQAAVEVARATGERGLLERVHRRFVERILPRLGATPSPVVLPQPPHDHAFGPLARFDAPWQMAALVYGLHALHAETGDPRLATAAVRVARVMGGPGWVEGTGPKYLVSAADPGRYILPVGFEPLDGTALMEVGGFVLAAELADRKADRLLFERRAHEIASAERPDSRFALERRWLQPLWNRDAEEAR